MRNKERKEKSGTKFKLGAANKSRQEMKHKNFQRDPSPEYMHVHVCVFMSARVCMFVSINLHTHIHTHRHYCREVASISVVSHGLYMI